MSAEPTPPAEDGFRAFRRDQRTYQLAFVRAHGPFPHPCVFCGDEVDGHTIPLDSLAAVVHHVDADRTNDAPENLVPAHHGCHVRFHHRGAKRGPETSAKISASKMGNTYTRGQVRGPETRAKISAARLGKPTSAKHRAAVRAAMTPEVRAKMSAAKRGKRRGPLPPETRAKISAALQGRPNAKSGGRSSCLNCRREIGRAGIARHLRACLADRDDV